MSASLEKACQEMDDLLEQCLLTWVETIERHRETRHVTRIHGRYLQASSQLYHARSTLEAALQSLATDLSREREEVESGDDDRQIILPTQCPVNLTVRWTCLSTHDPEDCPVTGSRADRPSRPRDPGRGTARDWNRDVRCCRSGGAIETDVCSCSEAATPQIDDVEFVETEQSTTIETLAAGSDKTQATTETHIEKQQTEQIITGEPRGGTKTKSTGSSRRRQPGNTGRSRSKPEGKDT